MTGRTAILSAAAMLFALPSIAQTASGCKGPAELEAAVRGQPGAEVYTALGYWFIEQKQRKCAIPAFRTAVKLDGNSLEARYNLGVALAETGDYAASVEHLRVAARLKPDDPNVRNVLSEVERQLSAVAAGHFQRSVALLENRQPDLARKELEAALRAKPDFTEALVNLGVICQQQRRTKEAEQLFRRAIAANGRYAPAYLNLGLSLEAQKRYAEASQVLKKGADADPANPAMHTAYGMTLVRLGQMDEAAGALKKVVELQPASAEAHLNLGVTLADQSKQAEALDHFEQAVKLAPRSFAAHYNRGRALHELRRHEEARSALEECLRLKPGYAPAMLRLGMTESRLGQPAKAVALIEKVIALDPDNATARHELGQALADLGREEEGLAQLKRAVELEPRNSQAAFALFRLLSRRQSPEAAEYSRRVRELKREELSATQARVLSNFALDAAKEKKWPEAVGKMREALSTCGQCQIRPFLEKNLGLIMAQAGDLKGAAAQLAAAKQLLPEDRDIQFAIDLLPRLGTP